MRKCGKGANRKGAARQARLYLKIATYSKDFARFLRDNEEALVEMHGSELILGLMDKLKELAGLIDSRLRKELKKASEQ